MISTIPAILWVNAEALSAIADIIITGIEDVSVSGILIFVISKSRDTYAGGAGGAAAPPALSKDLIILVQKC